MQTNDSAKDLALAQQLCELPLKCLRTVALRVRVAEWLGGPATLLNVKTMNMAARFQPSAKCVAPIPLCFEAILRRLAVRISVASHAQGRCA